MSSVAVSVLIVAFNSKAFLPRQIEALARQTMQDFEVVLLDNASRADQRPLQPDLGAGWRLIQSETNLGFAAGNNRAAEVAQAPLLALLNPDAFPDPEWLARLVEAAAKDPGAAAFGSTQISADDPTRYDGLGDVMFAFGLPYRSGYGAPVERYRPMSGDVFSACAAAMLIRRDVFVSVGGFDERFFCYGEDVDLGFRLRLLGWRSVQVGAAIVHHVGGGSSGARSAFGDFHGARNRLWTFVQNMPGLSMWALLPAHLLASMAVMGAQSLQGRGAAAWRGFFAGLAGGGAAMAARGRVQRRRKARMAEVLKALAWNPLVLLGRKPVVWGNATRPSARGATDKA